MNQGNLRPIKTKGMGGANSFLWPRRAFACLGQARDGEFDLQIKLVSPRDSCYTFVVMYSPAPTEAVFHGERDQKAALAAPTLPARARRIRAQWQPRTLNHSLYAIDPATP